MRGAGCLCVCVCVCVCGGWGGASRWSPGQLLMNKSLAAPSIIYMPGPLRLTRTRDALLFPLATGPNHASTTQSKATEGQSRIHNEKEKEKEKESNSAFNKMSSPNQRPLGKQSSNRGQAAEQTGATEHRCERA